MASPEDAPNSVQQQQEPSDEESPMNPDGLPQILELLLDGAMLVVLAWVLLFIVIFIDQIRKGR
jgi:hypothetical protein